MPPQTSPLADTDVDALFAPLAQFDALLLAVSGGPDSTALLVLMARWRGRHAAGPRLFAATVDHGLRPQSADEARAVGHLAAELGVPHAILRWRGRKPATGLQEAARAARYRLLAAAARTVGACHIVTAHTLDDQGETVLFRLSRGSGIAGLAGMAPDAATPGAASVRLARPFLGIAKARLTAVLTDAGIGFVDDPSNRDPRFARPRLRRLVPLLAAEGFDARRLAMLGERARRADTALEWATERALSAEGADRPTVLPAAALAQWPPEIALRALARAIGTVSAAPLALHKLEALAQAVQSAAERGQRLRRTLAGAMVTVAQGQVSIEPAPPRRRYDKRAFTRSVHEK